MTGPRPVAAIVYLDVDDEITSAASRIRTVTERRLALVLPGGSRVSTSRINFRLLAREATAHGRDLAIVAPEASTRALAASAGLPVFASVAAYEAALTNERPDGPDEPPPTAEAGAAGERADGEATRGAGPTSGTTPSTAADVAADSGPGQLTGWWARDAADAAAAPPRPGAVPGRTSSRPVATLRTGAYPTPPDVRPRSAMTDTVAVALPEAGEEPARRRFSGFVLALIGTLIVVLVVGTVAGWLLLPAATITVAARVDPVGPLQFTVRADPLEVTEDPANGIVPAQVVSFDLNVSQDFPSTGKKVSETKASGSVRWSNCDQTRAYTIPSGTVVRTNDGTGFATADDTFIPVALVSGRPPQIQVTCQSRDVDVTAVQAGLAGNVAAGAIDQIPTNINSVVISVTNPAATAGGTHTETKIVAQKDIDAANATLAKALRDSFTAQLADPSHVPAGLTLFPTTKSMSSGDPTVDPSSLVGQAMPTFTLGLVGTGTATAVDPSLVQRLGDARVRAAISPGDSLVKDSVDVRIGTPRVDGSAVLFPVTASASEVNSPDAEAIRAMVKGLSVDEARQRLRNYGDATIDVWPGWVTSITTYDFRLDVHVVTDVATEPITPAPTPSPSILPSAAPSTAPSGAGSASPAVGGSSPPGPSSASGAPSLSPRPSAKPHPGVPPSAAPSAT